MYLPLVHAPAIQPLRPCTTAVRDSIRSCVQCTFARIQKKPIKPAGSVATMFGAELTLYDSGDNKKLDSGVMQCSKMVAPLIYMPIEVTTLY